MFNHVVMFKLKSQEIDKVKYVKEVLEAMDGNIPQLKGLEVGVDEIHSDRSFDICLITKFDSIEDMNEYQVHQYHVEQVLAKIKPFVEVSKVVDYKS